MGILQGRVMYCGDAVSDKGGDYFTAIFGENIDSIYVSEKKIFELNPLIIAPGHGKHIINESISVKRTIILFIFQKMIACFNNLV